MAPQGRGYIGASKSVNAMLAEEEGKRPLTKITKQWLTDAGIDLNVSFVKYLIRTGFLTPAEWHHTSKFYNETDYYDAENLAEQVNNLSEEGRIEPLLETYQRYPNPHDAQVNGLLIDVDRVGEVAIWRAFALNNLQMHLGGHIDVLNIPELFGENNSIYVLDEGLYTDAPTRAILTKKGIPYQSMSLQETAREAREAANTLNEPTDKASRSHQER